MKQNCVNEPSIISKKNSLLEKISFLRENNLDWKEIEFVTGLPSKFIKRISEGTHTVKGKVNDLLENIFDDAIAKLGISAEMYGNEPCPEVDLNIGVCEYHKIEIKSISVVNAKNDDKFVIQIHGSKLHD